MAWSLGVWGLVFFIIERFPFLMPYNYASNDPIKNIDLWGLQGLEFYNTEQVLQNEMYQLSAEGFSILS